MMLRRVYGALPPTVRRRLRTHLPASRQLWLGRRLAPLRVPQRLVVRDGRTLARDGGELCPVVRSETATPAEVRQANLDAVVRVLDAAGVPYVRVRPAAGFATTLVVAGGLREKTEAVVREGLGARSVRWLTPPPMRGVTTPNSVLAVFQAVAPPSGTLVLGGDYACEIEFWREEGGSLHAPRPNGVASRVGVAYEPVPAAEEVFGQFAAAADVPRRYTTRDEFAHPGVDHLPFPIDAVYTWVEGSDPAWQARKAAALGVQVTGEISHLAGNDSRYASRDELRYSMRSVAAYAPWIRHVYLVTDDQVPAWLDPSHPGITVVSHREIFGDTGSLPTFNSHAIESRLHRIEGLSEHFLYFNDDMMLGRPVPPTTFFLPNGIARFFVSPAQLEAGPPGPDDAPVNAAGKNNREIMLERHGCAITQKMRHAPYALRRSVLAEIEAELPDRVLATAAHPFRHPGDLSIASSLHQYWAYRTGRAVVGDLTFTYADLAHPATPTKMRELLTRRDVDAFCLNDTDSATVSAVEQRAMMGEFLPAYFPFRSPFERAGS
jgi:hypothetical protein